MGQLVAAAERLADAKGRTEAQPDWIGLVEEAYDRLAEAPFRATPLHGFERTLRGKVRRLSVASPVERLIEEALRPLLDEALEARLPSGVHGYRKGRSTYTAAAALSALLAEGRHHVVRTDVRDFFPSLRFDVLERAVLDLLGGPRTAVAMALARAPIRMGEVVEARERGVPLGRALAPSLSNAYLLGVDEALAAGGVGFVRYADDVVIAMHDAEGLAEAHALLVSQLAARGLDLHPDKTRTLVYDGRPWDHLGHVVSPAGVFERVGPWRLAPRPATQRTPEARPATAPRQRSSRTLYIVRHGAYVRVERGLVQVRAGSEVVREIPIRRLDRVLVMAGVAMTSGCLTACIERRIPVVFFVGRGRAFGSLVASHAISPLRRRAQYALVADEHRRVDLAADLVAAKIEAMAYKVGRRGGHEGVLETLGAAQHFVAEAADMDALMGIEGAATAAYFKALATWIRADGFAFTERSRRPPRDPVNSLLCFSYTLLFAEVQTSLLAHGLDPHVGFLHALHRNHPALASDLLEPYRASVVDPFVLGLINNRRVRPEGFSPRGARGGIYMDASTRRVLLEAWEGFMRRPLGPRGSWTPRRLVEAAVLATLEVVMGEREDLRLPVPRGLAPAASAFDEEEVVADGGQPDPDPV